MASFLGLDLSRNVSLYTVPVALLLAIIPQRYASALAGQRFDIAYPRSFTEQVSKDETIDKQRQQRILRASAAGENNFENLGFYAAAVVAANLARVRTRWLNGLSLGYVVGRAVYNFVYVHLGGNKNLVYLRTVAYNLCTGAVVSLYVMAGNQLREL